MTASEQLCGLNFRKKQGVSSFEDKAEILTTSKVDRVKGAIQKIAPFKFEATTRLPPFRQGQAQRVFAPEAPDFPDAGR